MDSLIKHPHKLRDGLDAKNVPNIGPKIADMLQQMWLKHLLENPASDTVDADEHGKKGSQSIQFLSQSTEIASPVRHKKKQKNVHQKKYIPRYRSGGYGILLALYTNSTPAPFGSMTKSEIISYAQQFTDASFVEPTRRGNSQFLATAWSSINILLKKELVRKEGIPHRFCLTEDGIDLARQLATHTQDTSGLVSDSSSYLSCYEESGDDTTAHETIAIPNSDNEYNLVISGSNSFSTGSTMSRQGSFQLRTSTSDATLVDCSNSTFKFTYIDADGFDTLKRDEAVVQKCGSFYEYKIRFKHKDAPPQFLLHVRIPLAGKSSPAVNVGFLNGKVAPKIASDFLTKSVLDQWTCSSTLASYTATEVEVTPRAKNMMQSVLDIDATPRAKLGGAASPISKQADPSLVHFPPDSFDVYIIIDNRETIGRKRPHFFQSELETRGIKVMTRTLPLGDFLWVAKPKPQFQRHIGLSQQANSRLMDEVVLDFVVERKTLNDLVSSIKDDRFREQKFRLQKCGLNTVIYLVEEGCMEEANAFGMDKIVSAIIQTQILNKFNVQKTQSAQGTVEFLASLTRMIISRYKVGAIILSI